MDLENEKIGPAYKAPDSYFKETESRLMQRLGIQADVQEKLADDPAVDTAQPAIQTITSAAPLDTTGVQKRARKQDPMTAKSEGINKEVDALGNVVIPPLTFTTNENPEWVNFGAIPEEVSANAENLDSQIKIVSFADANVPSEEEKSVVEAKDVTVEIPGTIEVTVVEDESSPAPIETSELVVDAPTSDVAPIETSVENPVETVTIPVATEPTVIVHEVPESVGLDELESYLTGKNQPALTRSEQTVDAKIEAAVPLATPRMEEVSSPREMEEKPISLEAPATAFAPIAGRQNESATPGWLGVAAAFAAIVAAYFIWTAIQPPKADTEQVALQEEEATIPEAPLDEQVQTDTIPDGRQIVEPLIMEEMPKYKEPNVYTIIDAADMPERTKRALQDLEDNGLATFDMEDELFEELDFESL
ncbi:MAG: hypothetical protein EBT66_02280 [Bacteroidetes bacterium]|nr:hypothetical protein [Bacteroidota bacterium]